MESAVKQRVKFLIDTMNINVPSLARKYELSERTVFDQINGNSKIGVAVVEALLLAYPEISAEWLLRGEGNQSRGYRDDKGTNITIDASGDHIQGNNNKNTINQAPSEELIELRVENKMLKEQIEDLRKDKDNLMSILKK